MAGRAPRRGRRAAAATAKAEAGIEEAKSAAAAATRTPRESYPGAVGGGLEAGLGNCCTVDSIKKYFIRS